VRRVMRRHRAAERRAAAASQPAPQQQPKWHSGAQPHPMVETGALGPASAAAAVASRSCSPTMPYACCFSSPPPLAASAACESDCSGGGGSIALDPAPWWESHYPPVTALPRGVAGR
jgi:hypothetical protein